MMSLFGYIWPKIPRPVILGKSEKNQHSLASEEIKKQLYWCLNNPRQLNWWQ